MVQKVEKKYFNYLSRREKENLIKGIRGIEIAKSISKSLEKKSIAVKVNGQLKDLSDEINNDPS